MGPSPWLGVRKGWVTSSEGLVLHTSYLSKKNEPFLFPFFVFVMREFVTLPTFTTCSPTTRKSKWEYEYCNWIGKVWLQVVLVAPESWYVCEIEIGF